MAKIICLECKTVLESKSRHDFQMCQCSNQTFVDGGELYTRCGGVDLSKIQVLKNDNKKCHTKNAQNAQRCLE